MDSPIEVVKDLSAFEGMNMYWMGRITEALTPEQDIYVGEDGWELDDNGVHIDIPYPEDFWNHPYHYLYAFVCAYNELPCEPELILPNTVRTGLELDGRPVDTAYLLAYENMYGEDE